MLTRLTIVHLRNLIDVELEGLAQVNLFTGENGAGKTSLLEALHLLGAGRSFRHTQIRPVIHHDADHLLVSCQWLDERGLGHTAGLQRWKDGRVRMRHNGESLATVAELASLFPMQVMNSSSLELVEGSPVQRRQLLDWGLFHVEPGFFPAWLAAQRALRQRNALLKHGKMDRQALNLWTHAFVQPSEQVQKLRREYFSGFREQFDRVLSSLDPALASTLQISLYPGWGAEHGSLSEALERGLEVDVRRGHTRFGPHRADMRISCRGRPAHAVLSRGQTKLVAAAMKMAQGSLYSKSTNRPGIYLVDDLAAELDERSRRSVAAQLSAQHAQVFVTAMEAADLMGCWSESLAEVALFHVEQGRVSRR